MFSSHPRPLVNGPPLLDGWSEVRVPQPVVRMNLIQSVKRPAADHNQVPDMPEPPAKKTKVDSWLSLDEIPDDKSSASMDDVFLPQAVESGAIPRADPTNYETQGAAGLQPQPQNLPVRDLVLPAIQAPPPPEPPHQYEEQELIMEMDLDAELPNLMDLGESTDIDENPWLILDEFFLDA